MPLVLVPRLGVGLLPGREVLGRRERSDCGHGVGDAITRPERVGYGFAGVGVRAPEPAWKSNSVSYTHLTLPTICSV